MNYPVWQLDAFGGGLLIAIVAIFHVYISHFAVGGGLFLVLTEHKGYREKDQSILDYGYKHTKFFLLITMVAGGISGVGIWFTIALLSPAATSVLIHQFVFAWATEWVFFTVEIISLLIYYYTYGRMNRRNHLIMGWIYFAAAWMSLFIINGIIDFMLTPGDWIQTHNFWDGIFNPTFWPSLFFRTALCIIIAGLFGFMTAAWIKETTLRQKMVRYCALYLLIPFAILLGSAWWYKATLPAELQTLIFDLMPEMKIYITSFLYLSPILVLGGLLLAVRLPGAISRPIAVVMLLMGLAYIGSFEFIREGGRRPYILRDYMYSSSILKEDMAKVQQNGLLKEAKWVRNKQITADNKLAAGQEIFSILCLPCHSIGGPLNDITESSSVFSEQGLESLMAGMHKTHPYMPPFAGTDEERKTLAHYISYSITGQRQSREAAEITPVAAVDIPPFNANKDEYVLLAWSDMGIRSMTDSSHSWMMLPPGVTISATLIHRGETPEVVTKGIQMEYEVAAEFNNPAAQIDFWQYAPQLFNKNIPLNTGLTGSGLKGTMEAGESAFSANLLPLIPYQNKGGYLPYPTMTITAKNNEGTPLITTTVVAPVATEMGCRNCHAGPWRRGNKAGISTQTAGNILTVHDRLSGTNLSEQVEAGQPVLCQQCHSDSNGKHPGNEQQLNMSAAIHGFHANFMAGQGATGCTSCHPSAEDGATRAFRGIHHRLELDCTNCHGNISDHALSLLKAEQEKGKKRADILINWLQPSAVATVQEISPREPWVNQPDCLDCHQGFKAPKVHTTFNKWTAGESKLFINRTDESGKLRCAACHNTAHAIYPNVNPYNKNLDNIQPLQYQGEPFPIGSNRNCSVCHTTTMTEELHHPNMLREFRNR